MEKTENYTELKILFNNFDVLAEAPNGIKKMRELVLQLAVMGKLTEKWREENPDVEPASVLLEKIKKEKEKLIEDGKIRKQNPLPELSKEEQPFEIPDKWIWCRVGEFIELKYGKDISKKDRNENGKIPFYGANGILDFHDSHLVKDKSIIVGRKGSAGAINKVLESCWVSDVAFYIDTFNYLNFGYAYYFLKALNLSKLAKGIKPGLNRNEVYIISTLLPPLAEQEAIVETVDRLMALCDQLEKDQEKKKAKLLSLNKASLSQLNDSNGDFQQSWERVRQHFDLLYSHPDNVKELKQAILQLAVMGKLTEKWREENPDVEPASVLLEKIKEEKEKLIKDGKIKKTNQIAEIKREEELFILPNVWKWNKLGNICEIIMGQSPNSDYYNTKNQGLPFFQGKSEFGKLY